MYFSDKYFGYYMSKIRWCGLQSYKINRDLILFDYFNVENLKNLSAVLSKELLDKVYKISGYGKKINSTRNMTIYPYMNKNIVEIEGINPGTVYDKNKYDAELLPILTKLGFDGFIRRVVKTSNYGSNSIEELVANSSVEYLFDYDDPLCWVNWKLRPELKNGFLLDNVSGFSFSEYTENINFKLIYSWFDNIYYFKEINYPFVMIYEVCEFYNLNQKIDRRTNKQNIINMINSYKNLKLLILKNCSDVSDKINLPFISYYDRTLTMGIECKYSDDFIEIKCNYSKTLPRVYKVL
jgi:hypothetical protein